MSDRDDAWAEEETDEAPEAVRGSDLDALLATLDQVFSTFQARLRDEAPKPFDGAARVAVDKFNDIVAGLKFVSVPRAPTIAARPISLTEIELTWTDDTLDADGYKVKRCHGRSCENFVEISRLPPSVRSFRDGNLAGNTIYRYQLVTFNSRGETPSNVVHVTTTNRPPRA